MPVEKEASRTSSSGAAASLRYGFHGDLGRGGTAIAIVIATGKATAFGDIAGRLAAQTARNGV